jgi:hypothetical protein
MQDGQLLRVAPVGLDPFSRLTGDHRWRDHNALMAKSSQLAMNAVSASTSLVAEVEFAVLGEPLRHLRDIVCRVRDHSEERTAPFRPSSATLMDMVALCTSIPTNDLLICFMSSSGPQEKRSVRL